MPLFADLPYRQPGSVPLAERCRADLHIPDAPNGTCLVWLHGGGITGGDRRAPNAVGPLLAAGVTLISPDYRLLHHAPWPACLADAAAVTAWAGGALAARGVACKRLFLGGISAGAYLAAMVGLDRRWLAEFGLDPAMLAGVVPLSGQMSTHFARCRLLGHPPGRTVVDDEAPLWHVRADAPPLLLIAGSADIPCRPEENALMLAALRAVGHTTASYHNIPGRDHGTIAAHLDDPRDPVAELLLRFVLG